MQGNTIVLEAARDFDWINAASGLLGVVLGAALTYLVTYQFERRRTRTEQLGKAYSLFFAVLKIADDLTKMELELSASVEKAEAAGVKGELWTRMTSSVGYSDPVAIPASDLAIVALTRDSVLTTQIGEAESAHRIFTQSLLKLDQLKEKFEAFGLHTAVEGQTVSFSANEAELARVGRTLIQLKTLSTSIAESLPRAAAKARSVGERLGPHLKQHYKFKHFLTLSFPTGDDQEGAVVSKS